MYAVRRPHPLRPEAEAFFESALREGTPLATSAEVLQELLHAYLPAGRLATLDAAQPRRVLDVGQGRPRARAL
jgi:hypothetical protein